jgi:hypothetical protein
MTTFLKRAILNYKCDVKREYTGAAAQTVIITKEFYGVLINGDETGDTCSKQNENSTISRFLMKNHKREDHFRDLCAAGGVLLVIRARGQGSGCTAAIRLIVHPVF